MLLASFAFGANEAKDQTMLTLAKELAEPRSRAEPRSKKLLTENNEMGIVFIQRRMAVL